MSWILRAPFVFSGSVIWSAVNAVVRRRAARGRVRLPVRVISVGNIQAGGAGKTPVVAFIAREALARGMKVCILTRGYGGAWEKRGGVLRPEDAAPEPSVCGDEPALLHELAPGAWIAVGADRAAAFQKVSGLEKFDLAILDDGFQHWRLERDLDIVLVTGARPWQRLHRECRCALRHAGLVCFTKDAAPLKNFQSVRVSFSLPPVERKRIWLVSGVADAAHVAKTAVQAGYVVEREICSGDHARYSREEVLHISGAAASRGCRVAVTGKDWVKWRALGVKHGDVEVLEPVVEIAEGRDAWNQKLWA
ncbi:MAG: tetraacyldisaccharide 4'-kinase [Bdellovibrionales bacterium RIFOXYD1_FULL_53_11]|nr:MAG: tetraacyldisaccharide 4'-kinase [Bdellovibrionales bacterium RIFOXYD1_FULL_53_11]